MIASAVVLSTIDHIFAPDILYEYEDRENGHKYREIGWILLSIGIAGVIIQGVLAIMRKLYRESYIEEYFITFASIVSLIFDTCRIRKPAICVVLKQIIILNDS